MTDIELSRNSVPPRERKYFSIREANDALPFVRRVVEDIVASYGAWKRQIESYEIAAINNADSAESDAQLAAQQEVDELASQINGFIKELEQVGCEFKGFDDGLVDFRSSFEGRDVLLCWKLGEPAVAHWHDVDGGFVGRMKLGDESENEGDR